MTEARWNFYKLQGGQARRAGVKKTANPYRNKPSQRDAESGWDAGHEEEDDARRRK